MKKIILLLLLLAVNYNSFAVSKEDKERESSYLLQIKNETMVVGIDIGKETHYARAFDNRGIKLKRGYFLCVPTPEWT